MHVFMYSDVWVCVYVYVCSMNVHVCMFIQLSRYVYVCSMYVYVYSTVVRCVCMLIMWYVCGCVSVFMHLDVYACINV